MEPSLIEGFSLDFWPISALGLVGASSRATQVHTYTYTHARTRTQAHTFSVHEQRMVPHIVIGNVTNNRQFLLHYEWYVLHKHLYSSIVNDLWLMGSDNPHLWLLCGVLKHMPILCSLCHFDVALIKEIYMPFSCSLQIYAIFA